MGLPANNLAGRLFSRFCCMYHATIPYTTQPLNVKVAEAEVCEWGTVEADDDSYFEPTVHTYAKIEIEGNEAEVKGYALRGTDEVEEQGFIYWETEDEVASMVKRFARRKGPSIPANARVVAATGQVMNARLTNLSYGTTYDYVAFVKTSKGETFYGEQQTFKTEGDLTAISHCSINHLGVEVAPQIPMD